MVGFLLSTGYPHEFLQDHIINFCVWLTMMLLFITFSMTAFMLIRLYLMIYHDRKFVMPSEPNILGNFIMKLVIIFHSEKLPHMTALCIEYAVYLSRRPNTGIPENL